MDPHLNIKPLFPNTQIEVEKRHTDRINRERKGFRAEVDNYITSVSKDVGLMSAYFKLNRDVIVSVRFPS